MKRRIPWSSIVGFLLLLALGIGIPFWLEYRSLTNPLAPTVRAAKTGGDTERRVDLASPLSLKTLDRPTE
jgi:hypothetical protein